MSNPKTFLNDAFRELSMAQQDVFNLLMYFDAKRPQDSAADIEQAKRRIARATAALTMLEGVGKPA